MPDGFAQPDYRRLAATFARQIEATDGGAALAVYHRGELVVDLWGGARTPEGDPWEQDTLAMCFSTTKGAVSTAVHLLADAGELDYEAPVATYWPEFAQGGKEKVLVRHVLTHSAGLHRIRTLVDHARRMLDWDYMTDALAHAEPAYEPGTQFGYHALTYGWLAGFGHFGFGGSGAWADPKRKLAIAMVCNRGSGTPIGDVRMAQLGTAAIADADALVSARGPVVRRA